MPPTRSKAFDHVEWAHRANSRWIVHHGLKDTAEAYLTHLESADFDRLVHSCRRADQMVRACEAGQDPKPWFYAGLFSLATVDEANQFLDGHWFTASCIPSLTATVGSSMAPESIGPDTRAKLDRISMAVAKLDVVV